MGALAAFVGVGLLAALAAPADYDWPLDAPRTLTSSFGEPRRTHIHAGIDLGTGGRTGIACRAVGDGWVARLRMSPFGFGKALYVQLDDGPLVVYAHLDGFAAPMAERAWREQVQRGRYTFDVQLPAQEIRVQRGQIVAWSGDTGVGYPHLHFEVRDGDVATNPQNRGFAVDDAVPPTLQAVEILPLDAQAHVEGGSEPVVLEAPPVRPLRAAGRLGFAVRAFDRAAPGHQQVPYRYEVRVDGRPLFRAVHERFDYADNHQIVLDYDQEELWRHDRRYFLLFARASSRLPGREAAAAAGRGQVIAGIPEAAGLDDPSLLAPGAHEVEVEVADVAGQSRQMRFSFLASSVPQLEPLQVQVVGDSVQLGVTASDADGDSLELRLQQSRDPQSGWTTLPWRAGERRHTWRAAIAWDGKSPLVFRARVTDPSGLQALATGAPARPERQGKFALRVTNQWRYGLLEIGIEPEAILSAPPRLALLANNGKRREVGPLRQTGDKRYAWSAAVEDLEDFDGLAVEATASDGRRAILQEELQARILRRGRARRIDLHPSLRFEFERQTLLETIALRLRDTDPAALGLGPELRPAGPCVVAEPRTAALDAPVRVHVVPAATPAAAGAQGGIGLFVWERGQLTFLAAPNEAGELVGESSALGIFAVLRDSTPPVLRDFRCLPRRGAPPQLQCFVADAGSDLGDGDLQAHIDGVVAIPEWDPESGRVRLHPTRPLAAGAHRLVMRAEDRVGNQSERSWEFTLP